MNDPRSDPFEVLLRHALSRTAEEPPPDFAQQTAALVVDAPEGAQPESLATRLLLVLGVTAVGWSVFHSLGEVTDRLSSVLERAPCPLLVIAALALTALKLGELARR